MSFLGDNVKMNRLLICSYSKLVQLLRAISSEDENPETGQPDKTTSGSLPWRNFLMWSQAHSAGTHSDHFYSEEWEIASMSISGRKNKYDIVWSHNGTV